MYQHLILLAATVLRGLVLLSDEAELLAPEETAQIEGLHTENITPPGKRTDLEALLSPFCSEHSIDSETIATIKKAIHSHYIDSLQPLALVSVPPQNITSGTLQVVVAPSKLDRVLVKGGSPGLERLLPFAAGDEIQSAQLQKNLNFFNRNPFRKMEAVFSPGSLPRTTDITLLVQEERPVRFFAGTDNTGVLSTWQGRLFSGLHFTKSSFLGSLIYNVSYDFHRFQSWSGSCTAFLPWKHIAKLSGSYALIHPDTTDFKVKSNGMSDQASFRYTIPSLDSATIKRDLSFGFDFKQMSNILEYAIFAPSYSEIKLAAVSQLVAEYTLSNENLELQLSAFASPGELFPHQSSADFSNMRAGAQSLYAYANGSFKYGRKFRFGTASLSSSAQIATGALLPSEQVGIGGYGTVRGYDERQYNADQAILSSLEWAFPSWPLLSLFNRRKISDAMHLLLFADGAYGTNYGENTGTYLLSAGPGLRYTFAPYLALRLDLGFRLHEEATFVGDFYKWHFNLTGSY